MIIIFWPFSYALNQKGKEKKGRVEWSVPLRFCLVFFSLYLKYISESKEASKENLIDEWASKLLVEDGSWI